MNTKRPEIDLTRRAALTALLWVATLGCQTFPGSTNRSALSDGDPRVEVSTIPAEQKSTWASGGDSSNKNAPADTAVAPRQNAQRPVRPVGYTEPAAVTTGAPIARPEDQPYGFRPLSGSPAVSPSDRGPVRTQVRGQSPTSGWGEPPLPAGYPGGNQYPPTGPDAAAGASDHYRGGMRPSGSQIAQAPGGQGFQDGQNSQGGGPGFQGGGPGFQGGGPGFQGGGPQGGIGVNPFDNADPVIGGEEGTPVPFDVFVEETRTGRFIFGVGVNSDAGVTGQIVIDERNFDITRIPTSFDDVMNGTAFRGGGQGFRMEALPGDQVQRYLVSFTEPYLFDTQISASTSGSYYDRRFFDWDEQRLGGRAALGYRLTPDLSISGSFRGESVKIFNPRIPSVPELMQVVGDNELYGFRTTLTHDTRDVPFAPTEGHMIELSFEQVIGTFDYPRAEIDYRQHFLTSERPDGSGRSTLSFMYRAGFTGSQTPVFENYYAGGFSTLRGFDFRGAAPTSVGGVVVGGEFRFLGSVEYMFPLTADDMIKGVVFTDFGTVEEKIEINGEDYRVAVGAGLRIAIPALGPAPLALDFAIPLAREDTDRVQNFSFFFGLGRG